MVLLLSIVMVRATDPDIDHMGGWITTIGGTVKATYYEDKTGIFQIYGPNGEELYHVHFSWNNPFIMD